MSKKFKNKYRIASTRMKNYDYSSNGAYFITIVTKNRENFFGKIVDKKMILNELGEISLKYWREIPNHFSFIILDEMVIMPNHIHGILIINHDTVQTPNLGVSTTHPPRNKNHHPEWKPGTIGVIINQFKRICTIKSRKILPNFAWQSRFHDHIIRNEFELNRIRKYILQNPEKWNTDQKTHRN